MSIDINKHEVDIDNLFKQNVNDLVSIKELYRKLKDLEKKISQIKYIDSNLTDKLKKDYEKLKRIILDENIQAKLTNEINEIGTSINNINNDINEIDTSINIINNGINLINSQLEHKANEVDLVVERNRIDLLVKVENEQTEGNTELLDIRIGANGETYETAGASVRNQLNTKIDKYNKEIEMDKSEYITLNGNFSTNDKYLRSDLIFLIKGSTITYENLRGSTSVSLIYQYDLDNKTMKSLLNGTGYAIENTLNGSIDIEEDCYICVCKYVTTGLNSKITIKKDFNKILNNIDGNSIKINSINNKLESKIDDYKETILLSFAEYIKNNGGSFVTDTRYKRSDYIFINKNSILKYNDLRGSTSASLIYKYNTNKTPIGSLLNGEGYKKENTKGGQIIFDEDCYICVCSYFTDDINPSFEVLKKYNDLVNVITSNSAKITQFDKNIEEIKNTLESLEVNTSSKLYGKKIGFLGDSYIANNNWHKIEGDNIEPHTYTWAYKIAKKHNMEYNNYGVNGSAITKVRNSVPSFIDRYADMKNDLDYVVIVGGRNDFNLQVDINEFKTLLNGMLLGLIAKYPSAKMCFFTPWCVSKGSETFSQEDYANAIIEICGQNSIPVFDSYHKGGMYMHQKSFRAIYSQGESDVSHLNNLGHDLFKDKAESFILSI